MANSLISPEIPKDVRALHRKVSELIEVVNAIANMEVRINTDSPRTGILYVSDKSSLLVLQ